MVAAVAVGASVAGAAMSSSAAKGAAKTQARSAEDASAVQQAQYEQTRSDARPFYESGIDATNMMRQRMGLAPVQSSYQRDAADQVQAAEQQRLGDIGTADYASLRSQLAPQFTSQGQGGYTAGPDAGYQQGAAVVDEAGLNAAISQRLQAAGQGGATTKPYTVGEGAQQRFTNGTGTSGQQSGQQSGQFGFQAPTDRVTQAQAAINTATRQNSAQARPESADVTLQMDPGYAFRQQQGQQALERSAASRGGLLSGRAAKDTMDFSQGLASQEYGAAFDRVMGLDAREWSQNSELDQRDYSRDLTNANRAWDQNASLDNRDYSRAWDQDQNSWNRLAAMAGQGQTSQQNTSSLGANMANNVAGNIIGAGNATASGQVGAANAWNAAAGQVTNQYNTNRLYDIYSKAIPGQTTAALTPYPVQASAYGAGGGQYGVVGGDPYRN